VIVELVFPPVVDLKRVDLHAARDCHELKARTPARQRSADVDGFAGLQCALDRVFRSALRSGVGNAITRSQSSATTWLRA
jgi:hypothetical protein